MIVGVILILILVTVLDIFLYIYIGLRVNRDIIIISMFSHILFRWYRDI